MAGKVVLVYWTCTLPPSRAYDPSTNRHTERWSHKSLGAKGDDTEDAYWYHSVVVESTTAVYPTAQLTLRGALRVHSRL